MSSGNPMGLSEISHFGSFQRVGGKAGGFINKKFFHPSSIRNQERLWKAQTEDDRETRKQIEMQKRRDEERQVEELRKQMYLSGQGKSSDFLTSAAEANAANSHLGSNEKAELKQAIAAQQKRRALLRQEADKARAAGDSDEETGAVPGRDVGADRKLAKSRYPEDVVENGHTEVWGSWYSSEQQKWGFRCCKLNIRSEACPLHEEPAEREKQEPRGRRRQSSRAAQPASGSSGQNEQPGQVSEPPAVIDPSSLLDTRMLEAAAKRQKVNSFKEMQQLTKNQTKEDVQRSQYFEELLQDPADT